MDKLLFHQSGMLFTDIKTVLIKNKSPLFKVYKAPYR